MKGEVLKKRIHLTSSHWQLATAALPQSNIQHPTSNIQHPKFKIQNSKSKILHPPPVTSDSPQTLSALKYVSFLFPIIPSLCCSAPVFMRIHGSSSGCAANNEF
jgi:hypothetical protein